MRSQNLILGAKLEQLQCLLRRLALEHVQVFNHELVFLRPPYPKSLHIFVEVALFPQTC